MSQLLSLPENWDYHLSDLVHISLERKDAIRVAGNELPQAAVKSRLLKLDGRHIRFVFDGLRENATQARNLKQ